MKKRRKQCEHKLISLPHRHYDIAIHLEPQTVEENAGIPTSWGTRDMKWRTR